MKFHRIFLLAVLFFVSFAGVEAQTFLQHLKDENATTRAGKVIVIQSQAISDLVNNRKDSVSRKVQKDLPKKEKKVAEVVPGKKREKKEKTSSGNEPINKPAAVNEQKKEENNGEKPVNLFESDNSEKNENATSSPSVSHVPVYKRRVRVRGFSIQIFTGGNSRKDKIDAKKMVQRVQRTFPELPGRIHFNSPHWISRVGNFRTWSEAETYAHQIRRKHLSYEVRIVSDVVTVYE